jgi:hypothetical protein
LVELSRKAEGIKPQSLPWGLYPWLALIYNMRMNLQQWVIWLELNQYD